MKTVTRIGRVMPVARRSASISSTINTTLTMTLSV